MGRRKALVPAAIPVEDRVLFRRQQISTDTYCLPEGEVQLKYPGWIRPESLGLVLRWLALQMDKLQQLAERGPRLCDEKDCGAEAVLFDGPERGWCEEHASLHGKPYD